MRVPDVVVRCTLQEHRHSREAWAVGVVLIHEVESEEELPRHVGPGLELDVVGDRLGMAAPGERLELRGSWDESQYGLQLKIREQLSQGIQEPQEACRWLERLDGVGPKLAQALWGHFGDRLLQVLSGEIEADLTVVHGVGLETEAHIRSSYEGLAISGDLESIRYLDGIGCSRNEATKILKWCAKKRRQPIKVLESAPYDLMQIHGLGWSRVDRIARKAGCPPSAPARVEAATLYVLGEIVREGSTMAALAGGREGGLMGLAAAELGQERELVHQAIGRLASRGALVLAKDDRGRTWAHPSALLKAERAIYRSARGVVLKPSAPLSEAANPVPSEV